MKPKLLLLLTLLFISVPHIQAQFVITTVTDSTDSSTPGTLRWSLDSLSGAIYDSALVRFNLPGTGPFSIRLFEELFVYGSRITIDGTTQPGYYPGIIRIKPQEQRVVVEGDTCRIFGLEFSDASDLSGFGSGLYIKSSDNHIGAPGKENIFIRNMGAGISVIPESTSVFNIFQSNYIGTNPPDGFGQYTDQGNQGAGISFLPIGGDSQGLIGGFTPDEGNVIAYNSSAIRLDDMDPYLSSAAILSNKISCNDLGIEIFDASNTVIFPPPDILEATPGRISGTGIEVGSIIEVYQMGSPADEFPCAAPGCQGAVLIGTTTVDALGNWVIDGGFYHPNYPVTALATSSEFGITSTYAPCTSVECSSSDLVVTTTDEFGPGSLRSALICASFLSSSSPRVISFNIPGPAPHVIELSSAESLIISTNRIIIDGTTQPGYNPGDIVIDGQNETEEFVIYADSCEVYGLHIRNFVGFGLNVNFNDHIIGAPGKGNILTNNQRGIFINSVFKGLVQGNYIGTDPAGSTGLGNTESGIEAQESSDVIIGGETFDEKNVIAYNNLGVYLYGGAFGISLAGNSFICNTLGGIALEDEFVNDGKASPIIQTADFSSISGTADPGDAVEVFAIDNTGCSTAPCQGSLVIGTTQADANGNWSVAGNASLAGMDVTALATDAGGNTSEFSACMTVEGSDDVIENLTIPQAFTPDGDGINDNLVIPGLENYPDNELIILNRWGNQVFYSRSYQNDWTGTNSQLNPLQEGTYFFVLIVYSEGVKHTTRGAFTIVR